MKHILIISALISLLLPACGAKAQQLHSNTDGPVFIIKGSAFTSLDDLFVKANETCGEQGYTVINARDTGYGENAEKAQLVVQCKTGARQTR